MSNQNEAPNLDLLDRSLEDIEDVPGFEVPPQGTYQLLVNAEAKRLPGKDNEPGKDAVVLDYEVTNIVQLADPTGQPPMVGTKFGELFMLDNEYGLANLKKAMTPYAEHFGTTNLRSLVTEKVQNVVITATLKHRFNKKNDPQKENPFAQIVNVVIA